jgi:hypothetical protein
MEVFGAFVAETANNSMVSVAVDGDGRHGAYGRLTTV